MREASSVVSLPDPSVYPRVYRATSGWLTAMILCGLLLAVGGAWGAWFLASDRIVDPQARPWLIGLCLAIVALGIYCAFSTLQSKVTLFADRVELDELTRTTVLSRNGIRGWRSLPTSPLTYVFIPKDASHRRVKVAQIFRIDTEFAQWVNTLPCLDSDDARTAKAEIRNNTRLGGTPGERMKALARGKRIARVLAVAGLFLGLWGFIYPRPYVVIVAILAPLPWIAVDIVRRSGGLFRLDAYRNDAHPTVAIAFIMPGMILAARSLLDFNIVFSRSVVWFTIGIAALLFLSAWAVDPVMRTKRGTIASLLMFSIAYGYGAAMEANVLLDRSSAVTYTADVEGKRVLRGKTTTWELELGSWGPRTKVNKLAVAPATYNSIEQGDVVYLNLRQGALGVNWYVMRQWQRGSRSATIKPR